ncbi:MAG: hypothetical protein LBG07_10935 [Treponema sp.]|nr:hypothetical protein [Treponema sp.]
MAKKTTDQSGTDAICTPAFFDRKSSLVRLSGIKIFKHKQGTNLKSFIRPAGIPKQKTNTIKGTNNTTGKNQATCMGQENRQNQNHTKILGNKL